VAEKKQQLHQFIDRATELEVAFLCSFLESKNSPVYSADELNEFYNRRAKFLNGESKGYSVEEVHQYLRKGKSKNEL